MFTALLYRILRFPLSERLRDITALTHSDCEAHGESVPKITRSDPKARTIPANSSSFSMSHSWPPE